MSKQVLREELWDVIRPSADEGRRRDEHDNDIELWPNAKKGGDELFSGQKWDSKALNAGTDIEPSPAAIIKPSAVL